MSKTRFIKVAAIITIIAAGLGTGAFFPAAILSV